MEYQKTYHFEDYEKHGDVSKKKLDKLVDQLLDISEGWDSDGWRFVAEEEGVSITSTMRNSLNCTRGISTLTYHPDKVIDIAKNLDHWKKQGWKITESKTVYQNENEKLSLNYMEFSGWFAVANRDVSFLQYTTKRNGSHVILWHSCKDSRIPKKIGNVRGKISASGFVITPLMGSQSIVTFVLQFDLKGWIPQNVMEQITLMQPLFVLTTIEKELKQLYHPDAPTSLTPPKPDSEQSTTTTSDQEKPSTPKSSRYSSWSKSAAKRISKFSFMMTVSEAKDSKEESTTEESSSSSDGKSEKPETPTTALKAHPKLQKRLGSIKNFFSVNGGTLKDPPPSPNKTKH